MKKLTMGAEIPVWDVNDNTNVWKVTEDAWMYEGCGNERILVEVNSFKEAIEVYKKPILEYQWGASDMFYFETGLIYLNKKPIARVAGNGTLWQMTSKDLKDHKSWVKIEDIEAFEKELLF